MAYYKSIKLGTVSQSTLDALKPNSGTTGTRSKTSTKSKGVRVCNICGGTGIHPSTKAGPKQKK